MFKFRLTLEICCSADYKSAIQILESASHAARIHVIDPASFYPVNGFGRCAAMLWCCWYRGQRLPFLPVAFGRIKRPQIIGALRLLRSLYGCSRDQINLILHRGRPHPSACAGWQAGDGLPGRILLRSIQHFHTGKGWAGGSRRPAKDIYLLADRNRRCKGARFIQARNLFPGIRAVILRQRETEPMHAPFRSAPPAYGIEKLAVLGSFHIRLPERAIRTLRPISHDWIINIHRGHLSPWIAHPEHTQNFAILYGQTSPFAQ
jgi:hypothetical protein